MKKLYTLGEGLQGEGLKEVPHGYIHWVSIEENGIPTIAGTYLVCENSTLDIHLKNWNNLSKICHEYYSNSVSHYYGPINIPKDISNVI